MRRKKLLETTTSSRTYKLVLKELREETDGLCGICKYHRGCNYRNHASPSRSWKEYRNHQYK